MWTRPLPSRGRSNPEPLQPADDRLGKFLGRRRAAQVAGAHLIFVQRLIDRLARLMRKLAPVNVMKHHRGREQQRKRIGNPLPRKTRRRAMHCLAAINVAGITFSAANCERLQGLACLIF